MTRRLIIGGTFNPVHRGHIAMARGARDALAVARVDWVPCHTPHHRPGDDLLPFDLRCDLLRAALNGEAGMVVNTVEAGLPVPSLTWRTVAALRQADPGDTFLFALGPREFLRLHKWVRGRDIAAVTDIVVAPRGPLDRDAFASELTDAWPDARTVPPPGPGMVAWEILPGRHALLLDLVPVEVSATEVRARWRAGHDTTPLVPDAVQAAMLARRAEIDAIWSTP
ncbi:MAG: nicotinate-nicotinamide nucleotide adenylyltransferase [Pseudomonadota bacterium]|nr:nicotinate-nicotinamide nucleotide adenylyltransferase [Pseudomonadota bacterium]